MSADATPCSSQAYGQRLQLVDEQCLSWFGSAVETNIREALERLLDQDPQLQAGERGAQAEVASPRTERLVLGIAGDVEAVGVLVA